MRFAIPLLFLVPSVSFAQTKEMVEAVERKLANQATAKWVLEQEAPDGGFYLAPQDPNVDVAPRPMLRATNGAVRALKYLGFPLLNKEREKHAAFVLKCYDPKTGAFAEPGGKPDVAITSIGVMAAMELGVPKEKFAKAMDYLKENAKTFEEVRIGAAAVEAWGVKDCPFKLDEWIKVGTQAMFDEYKTPGPPGDRTRTMCSAIALVLRLGHNFRDLDGVTIKDANKSLRDDGGWGRDRQKTGDIETTYRVMRALMLLKEKPKNAKKLREFVESHRNKDGGYATKPGDKSTMSGVYYATIITKWLDEMVK
jgi:prenyltransferase beta subunit